MDTRFRVCQRFFEKTLSIPNGPILKALEGKNDCGIFVGRDKRGTFTLGNKHSEDQMNYLNSTMRVSLQWSHIIVGSLAAEDTWIKICLF